MEGGWYGTLEYPGGSLHTLQATVTGDNVIVSVDGVPDGLTYTIEFLQSGIYSVTASNGVSGGFYLDPSATYLVFLADNQNFAVAQKGATGLPLYDADDIVGSWSGFEVVLDASWDLFDTYQSNVSIAGDYSFSGSTSTGVTFNGAVNANALTYGAYAGTVANSLGANGVFHMLLSADKQFAGSWACAGPSVTDCAFDAWTKQ